MLLNPCIVEKETIPTLLHDYLRDTSAKILKEACYDVEAELKLQALQRAFFNLISSCSGDQARLNFQASRLWDLRFCKA